MKRRPPLAARRKSGFTLIEIAAVLILLGILAVGAVSILPDSDAELAAEADRLASHLRYAQIRAQADITPWRLRFIPDTQTYELGPVGFPPAIVPGAGATQRTLTGGVTAAPNGTDIRFDSWGRPVDGAGAPAADQAITLTQDGRTTTITILAGTGLIP